VRLFSTYGPGEKLDWLLPSVIRALLRSQSIELTAGEQVWDFLHIEDAVSALRILIDREYVGLVNLGSGKAVVLRDIFDLLEKKLDRKGLLKVGKLAYRTNQIMHLQADINELKSIGWIPKIELNDGLDQLIAFYKDKHLIEMSDNSN
jgi:nucleoside-diphosphate-sugar epimerase